MNSLKMNRMGRRQFLRWVTLAGGGALLTSCAPAVQSPVPGATPMATEPSAMSGTQPNRGGTVRWAMTREAAGAFDPALAVGSTGWYNHWVYESLVGIDASYSQLVRRLATSWEPDEEGKVWTFDLRKNVKFHHGREFVAADVIHTFERILDPDFGSSANVIFSQIEDLTVVDDHTVRFALSSANADFPSQLSNWNARIVPHDLSDEEIEREPRGTGPFTIDEYAHADRIAFYKFDDYWLEDKPYVDQVEFVTIPEATTLANALRAGEVDVYHLVTNQMIEVLREDPEIAIVPTPPMDKHQIYMQIDQPPFDDDRVRRAFKLIGDRVAMTEVAWPDMPATPDDDNPVVPANRFHIDTDIWNQDLDEARRLLSEAGYEDGLEVTLWTMNDEPGVLEFALLFADWAKGAGATINVEGVKTDRYYAEQWMQVPFGTVAWSPRSTADEQLRVAYHSEAVWNETHYRDPEFDRLLDDALAELDDDKRAEMYAELQQKIITEGGQIIPYHYARVSATRRAVQNYKPHPLNGLDPREVWLADES